MPLSVPAPGDGGHRPGGGGLVIDELIAPLTEAAGALVPVSPRVLWGNVASAVSGAAAQIAAQRPDLAGAAWAAARDSPATRGSARSGCRPAPASAAPAAA